MAKRISLREFQESVVAKLQNLGNSDTAPLASKLGVQVGAQRWLVDLADISEVVPLPETVRVPLTQPWFMGLTNVRGLLYGAIDFSGFMQQQATHTGVGTRLLLINPKYGVNAGLIVNQMLGLKNPEQFEVQPLGDDSPVWIAASYKDSDGRSWQEIDMYELSGHPDFLNIAA